MTANIIDGKAHAARLRAQVADGVALLARPPGLAVILVGDHAASSVYVRSKARATAEAGMLSVVHCLPADTAQAALLDLIAMLNSDDAIDGILVQLPLPPQIDTDTVIATIHPDKDVDGFHPVSAGRLATGLPGFVPCTPLGCLILLKETLGDLSGLDAVVIGRSNIVGKPMVQLLIAESCTVTVAHSKTRELEQVVRRADIIVAAVGRPEMVKADWIKPGATVIDVGINRVDGKLVGDVAFDAVSRVAGAITPVPGGVGPMTIACLLKNTLTSAERRQA
jgi:methylenetetrahydrofolate dehydrogenase (NADP+) / methenyltetrahydrofolate cyclohydrolase